MLLPEEGSVSFAEPWLFRLPAGLSSLQSRSAHFGRPSRWRPPSENLQPDRTELVPNRRGSRVNSPAASNIVLHECSSCSPGGLGGCNSQSISDRAERSILLPALEEFRFVLRFLGSSVLISRRQQFPPGTSGSEKRTVS